MSNVSPEMYRDLFERHPVGAAILDDLVGRYHDCGIGESDTEKTHVTARELGGSGVVILRYKF